MYVVVCIYFSLPRKRCELRDGEQSSHYWEAFYLFFFSFLAGGSTITSLVYLSICLFCYPYKRSLNLEKCHLCVCSTACSLCSMYVCTTRTVIYVVLCTLNLDPANDLVDLGKKEAAAESPVSFFSWLFFCLNVAPRAQNDLIAKKNERNINKDEKNTLFAMACDLCYAIRASVHLYSYICTVVVI